MGRVRWIEISAAGALVATGLEAAILQRKYATFTGGYLQPSYLQGLEVPVFLLLAAFLNATAVALPAPLAIRLTRGLRGGRRFAAATLLAAAPLLGCMLVFLGVFAYAVDVLAFRTGWSATAASVCVAALCAAGAGGVLWAAAYLPARDEERRQSRGRVLLRSAVLVVVALGTFAAAGLASPRLQDQLVRTTAGGWTAVAGRFATDFDRDAWDWVRAPFDTAPFDAAVHPFAVDRPGNGIDENGINGDLAAPGDFAAERFEPVRFARRPDVVLFVLETFRYGNLDAEVDGRPATPVLRGLVDGGAVLGPAYSHNGFTVESLVHLLTGSLTETGDTSLFDDFAENGYATAVVSGEDETFGDTLTKSGMARAEHFVDARDDADLRYTASAAPSSLAVPCTVVARNVERMLQKLEGDPRPLFAYVNFQDCHFPYHHAGLEPLLADDPVSRDEIVPANAARVERTYLNTVANVDAAVGRVLAAWERARGSRPAFVIVGDHGESFFFDGLLGHGIDLVGEQMRIPFLAGGLPVECTFPLGLSEVRFTLRRALTRAGETPDVATDPEKWVFQHTGPIGAPRRLGASSARGGLIFDLDAGTWRTWGDPAPGLAADRERILTLWEQILLHRAR